MSSPTRYDQLGPIARALVDDYDASDLAELLVKAQDELAALRQVAGGYCPACGRGDCSPTADQWYEQRQRADRAEAERDTARQHAAAIAAQRDRLRQRMNTLADKWDHALAVDKLYARTLRTEISIAPFHGTSTAVQQYRADDGSQKWAARCWGTDTCDGWLSLDHDSERWAEIARDRHVAEDHAAPTDWEPVPAAAQATDGRTGHVYLSTGCLHDEHGYCQNVDGIIGPKKPAQCKFCAAPCVCPCHREQPGPA